MSGFEMSPFGMVPIGTPSLHNATPEMAAQFVVKADYGNEDAASRVSTSTTGLKYEVVTAKAVTSVVKPASPRTVIAGARARVKEIKTELKRMRALQSELSELERLLKAAKQKPTPSVRPLRSVG